MKNPIGKGFSIEEIQGVDYLAYYLYDDVNKIRYEITEEPYVSILANTLKKNTILISVEGPTNIAFIGPNATNTQYIKDAAEASNGEFSWDTMEKFTDINEMASWISLHNFENQKITIWFAGELPFFNFVFSAVVNPYELILHVGAELQPGETCSLDKSCVAKAGAISVQGAGEVTIMGSVILEQ